MAERSICSNCGNPLKNKWLVCKYCLQARWKLIVPYYAWGVVFLIGAWWLINNELSDALNSTEFSGLLVIIGTVLFGIIGVVMLLMALIATLRGLFVKKVSAEQRNITSSQLATTNSAPLIGRKTTYLSDKPIILSTPEVVPLAQQEALEIEETHEQVIYCQKCHYQNTPEATHCSQCGTDLLPGTGAGERIGVFIASTIIALISFGGAYLFFRFNAEWGMKAMLFLVGIIVFGVLMIFFGIFSSLRKIPPYERFENRAKRHISLNAWQAIADYGSAINLAPPTQAFDYLFERAKLYQGQGKAVKAREEWQRALGNINLRLAAPKASIDLIKQRAEIFGELGMEDEYAIQMLRYTIEKEKTLKTKRSDIAMGWEEGIAKGSDDFKRQELDKIRAGILANTKYKIIGQCKNCRSIVELNVRLECTNNAKHKKISEIHSVLSYLYQI